MKKNFFYVIIVMTVMSTGLFAQNRFSVGIISTRFGNTADDSKLTDIKNPIGYGVVGSYALSEEISVAFTGEYYKDDMENNLGNERDLRGHISVFLAPLASKELRPYVSAGIVYTNRKIEYLKDNIEKNKNIVDARFGIGIDYHLMQNLFINVDLGVYNDGLDVVGWSSSVGLRYGINL
jgi:hypothetical protein